MNKVKRLINQLIKDTTDEKVIWKYTPVSVYLPIRPRGVLTTFWEEMRVSYFPYSKSLCLNGTYLDVPWYLNIVLERTINKIMDRKRKSEKEKKLVELLDGITFRDLP